MGLEAAPMHVRHTLAEPTVAWPSLWAAAAPAYGPEYSYAVYYSDEETASLDGVEFSVGYGEVPPPEATPIPRKIPPPRAAPRHPMPKRPAPRNEEGPVPKRAAPTVEQDPGELAIAVDDEAERFPTP